MFWKNAGIRAIQVINKGIRHHPNFKKQHLSRMMSSSYEFETLEVTRPRENVLQVNLNRPEKRNAMNKAFWSEMVKCFEKIAEDSDCRAVVLSGSGKIFTAGIDLVDMASVLMEAHEKDVARVAHGLRKTIMRFQDSFSVIEKCPQPVIAAVHSACVGGGVDMVCACDVRWCTSDAWFQIKEVELGLAADVGTLQRIPKIIGNDSLLRELCYTGRKFMSDEAKSLGLVSRIFQDKTSLIDGALDLASHIAKLSPVAVAGTKQNLKYSRDYPVEQSLEYMATWNMSMLQTEDIMKAVQAAMNKEDAAFSKL